MVGPLDAWDRAETSQEGSRHTHRHIDRDPARVALCALDGLEHVLLGLRREALETAEPPVSSGGHELVEAVDPELSVDHQRLLGTEPGDRGHRADTRWHLRSEPLEFGERSGIQHASNLLCDRLPHVRDRPDPRVIEVAKLIREPTDRSCGLLVGPGLEGIVRDDRQEVGELRQHARHVVVGAGHTGLCLKRGRTAAREGLSANAGDPRLDPTPPIAVRRSPRR